MCHLAQGNKQLQEEIGHICEKCSEPYRNALNNLVRLKSLSEELMDHLLAELNKKIILDEAMCEVHGAVYGSKGDKWPIIDL